MMMMEDEEEDEVEEEVEVEYEEEEEEEERAQAPYGSLGFLIGTATTCDLSVHSPEKFSVHRTCVSIRPIHGANWLN